MDSVIIVLAGAVLGFWQEFSAANALAALKALVSTRATVLRDGGESEVPADQIVPGDVILLSAGSLVPGDCRLLESEDLFVNESALTGESYPVEKSPGQLPAETPPAEPLGFVPLPPVFLAAMLTLVVLYAAAAELVKRWFYGTLSKKARADVEARRR